MNEYLKTVLQTKLFFFYLAHFIWHWGVCGIAVGMLIVVVTIDLSSYYFPIS